MCPSHLFHDGMGCLEAGTFPRSEWILGGLTRGLGGGSPELLVEWTQYGGGPRLMGVRVPCLGVAVMGNTWPLPSEFVGKTYLLWGAVVGGAPTKVG